MQWVTVASLMGPLSSTCTCSCLWSSWSSLRLQCPTMLKQQRRCVNIWSPLCRIRAEWDTIARPEWDSLCLSDGWEQLRHRREEEGSCLDVCDTDTIWCVDLPQETLTLTIISAFYTFFSSGLYLAALHGFVILVNSDNGSLSQLSFLAL